MHESTYEKRWKDLEGVLERLNKNDRNIQTKFYTVLESQKSTIVDLGRAIANTIAIMQQIVNKKFDDL